MPRVVFWCWVAFAAGMPGGALAVPLTDPNWVARHALALSRQGHHDAAEAWLQYGWKRAPDSVVLRVALARLAAQKGDSQYALALLHEALRSDVGCVEARIARAELLRKHNQISEAMQELEMALRLDPRHELADRAQGLLRLLQGQWEAAISHFTRYLNQVEEQDAEVLSWRGVAWMRAGRLANAEADFGRALQLDSRLTEIWRYRAEVLEKQGAWQKAAVAYERCLQAAPQDVESRLAYARLLYRMKRFPECSAQLEAIVQSESGNGEIFDAVVQMGYNLRQFRIVLAAIDRLLQIRNDNPDLWFRKAVVLEMLFRDSEALVALQEYEKRVTGQNKANALAESLLYASRARCWLKLGQLQLAHEAVEKALQRSPQYGYAFLLRADIRWRMGKTDEALADLNTAEQIRADEPYIFIKRAEILRTKGKWDAALKELDRAVRVNPQVSFAKTQRGGMLLLLGKWEEAQKQFAELLDGGDDHASTQAYAQAIIAALQGQWDQAERHAERSLAAFPTDALGAYNLACVWALLAHIQLRKLNASPNDPRVQWYKRRALDLLEKAFVLGYRDRWHTQHDPDLFVLHCEPAFWRLVREEGKLLTRP